MKYRRYSLILLFFLFWGGQLNAQEYKLKINVLNFRGDRAYLASLRGNESKMIDSMFVANGEILFSFGKDATVGMYRVFFDSPSYGGMFDRDPLYVDILFNYENIDMITSYEAPFEDMVVKESVENKKYFEFLHLKSIYRTKLSLLLSLYDLYGPGDQFFPHLYHELVELQKDYNDSLLVLSDADPEMLSSSIISTYREPVFDPKENPDLDEFMRENYLEPISFDDPRLLNSPVITNKILTYLSFFRIQSAQQEEQEEAFIQAVDNIMAEVSYNEELYDFVLNYLIDGFERFKMERVLVHIADNHLTGECKTENEEIVKERLDAYKRMAEGNKVPDINLLDPFDVPHRLSDVTSDRILLIFWSSECPHCTNLMPRLNKWYKEEKNSSLEVYAVSIDKSRADWEEFVLLNELEWINVYDPDGWESKISRQYNLYATPTMFLLDSNREILAKPVTFREFLKAVRN